MMTTEFIPAADNTSRRLMIMLHGLGDSIEGYRWWPEAMALPWMNYLLVNAPDEYYGGYSWFDIDDQAPGVLRSRKLLSGLLDDLRAKNFPADQITLGGFSQGCLMTMDVGLRYPHRLAGLVGISGWVFELEKTVRELSPVARQQRVLMTHGTGDPLVPIERCARKFRSSRPPASMWTGANFRKSTPSTAKLRWPSSAILCAPVIPVDGQNEFRAPRGEPRLPRGFGSSDLHFAVRAGHPDLFRARRGWPSASPSRLPPPRAFWRTTIWPAPRAVPAAARKGGPAFR